MPSDALAELAGRPETDRRVGERGGVPPLPERDSVDAELLERDNVVEEGPPLLAERERVEGPRPVEKDPARLIVFSAGAVRGREGSWVKHVASCLSQSLSTLCS